MRYFNLSFVSILLMSVISFAGDGFALSRDVPVNYYIEAQLDTAQKMLYGYERVEFLNLTDKPLDYLVLNLYPNAFRDKATNSERKLSLSESQLQFNDGYINCDSIRINGQEPDSVVLDGTILYLFLPDILPPGRRLTLSLHFEIKIPRVILRFGYDINGNYVLAHWLPILAGYQKNKIITYQCGDDGEFFSNFANYNVRLIIPETYLFQSSANNNKPDSSVDGMSYYNLVAEGVIDFAFVCGPAWQRDSYYHEGISIEILYLEHNSENLEMVKRAINNSFDYFSEKFYRYPYPNLSYIDFHPGAGGIELPRMIVMSFKQKNSGINRIELTAVHEMAHQWFYATVATNEFDEPWLDEGIATYLTGRCLTDIYGSSSELDIFGYQLDTDMIQSFISRLSGHLDPLSSASDEFKEGTYYLNVYGRAPAVLKTLESVLGTVAFDSAMREFANEYKFKHPDTYDFKRSLEKSSGINLDSFFDQFVFGMARLDYQVSRITTAKEDSLYTTSVELQRSLDGVLPQELIVAFKDGSYQSANWDGADRYESFEFESHSPAVYAAIDTANNNIIDEDMINNSLNVEPESSYTFALSLTFLTVLQLLFAIIGMV